MFWDYSVTIKGIVDRKNEIIHRNHILAALIKELADRRKEDVHRKNEIEDYMNGHEEPNCDVVVRKNEDVPRWKEITDWEREHGKAHRRIGSVEQRRGAKRRRRFVSVAIPAFRSRLFVRWLNRNPEDSFGVYPF
ncbi:MAG: hypothetical protein KGJ60_10870 [Verrucomicrobiota bacterium]|nr:hypothetical protein [Verrucomicrobiota bacterium]